MLCRGVSSFNTFLAEYDTDSESDSEYEYESGIEDNDISAPPSPTSDCSHLSRAGSSGRGSGRRYRRNKTLLQRLLLCILWPLRLLVHMFRLWYVISFALIFLSCFFENLQLKILDFHMRSWQDDRLTSVLNQLSIAG